MNTVSLSVNIISTTHTYHIIISYHVISSNCYMIIPEWPSMCQVVKCRVTSCEDIGVLLALWYKSAKRTNGSSVELLSLFLFITNITTWGNITWQKNNCIRIRIMIQKAKRSTMHTYEYIQRTTCNMYNVIMYIIFSCYNIKIQSLQNCDLWIFGIV